MLLLVLILVVSVLSACKNAGNKEVGSEKDGASNDKSVENDEVVELDMFINHSWWPIKEWNSVVSKEITKRTGVKLNIQVAADENQLPLMIASGDLPDLVYTSSEIDRLSDPKLSYAWNELIEEHAPSFKVDPTKIGVNTATDGNFYTIRNAFSSKEEWESHDKALPGGGTPGLAVREDILKELGNPPIDSIEDFENVLGMVKEKYPDMIPLVMDINHIGSYLKSQFGVTVGGTVPWYETEGDVGYDITHPAYEEYYKFMNRLYTKGYITPENFTFADDKKDDQLVLSGKAFAHMYVMRVADENNAALEKQGEDFSFKLITQPLRDDTVHVNSGIGWSGAFITKNNKNPEASIKFMEFMMSDEGQKLGLWGVEDTHWTWNPDGYPDFKYDTTDADFKNEQGIFWWGLFGSSAVTEGLGNYVPGLQSTEGYTVAKVATIYKPELGLIQPLADTEEKNIQTRLQEMVKNEETKIYLARSEEEAIKAYNQMIETAEKIGMNKLEEWATQEYERVSGFFK
jgi:putative aldouronate transport system substrate-binding protein